jgi:hypothetical protein
MREIGKMKVNQSPWGMRVVWIIALILLVVAAPVQASAKQAAHTPALGRIPVFSLPRYGGSSIIEGPLIPAKWVYALR